METVHVKADCGKLTVALESVLSQHGYHTLRSFDLPLTSAAQESDRCYACPERCSGACTCRYTVLLVLPHAGVSHAEAISIQGRGEYSTVILLSYDSDSELTAQFAPLLMEALNVFQDSVQSNGMPHLSI